MKKIEKTEGQTELHPASLKAMPTSEAGVVHAAGVLSDGTITKQNRRKYEEATGRPNFELMWPATDGFRCHDFLVMTRPQLSRFRHSF